jgi:hypothetical protein
VIEKHSAAPAADIATLFRYMTFNAAIGNVDDHLKHFRMLATSSGYRLVGLHVPDRFRSNDLNRSSPTKSDEATNLTVGVSTETRRSVPQLWRPASVRLSASRE